MPPLGLHRHDAKLNPSSLRKTLDAHRDANRDSLVRKVLQENTTGETTTLRPKVPYADPDELVTLTSRKHLINLNIRSKKKLRKSEGSQSGEDARFDYRENHVGQSVPLTPSWGTASEGESMFVPWMGHRELFDGRVPSSAREALNWEIRAFETFISPSKEETEAARLAVDDIGKIIRRIDGRLQVNLVGSRANGLATPLSDIDINITHPSLAPRNKDQPTGIDYSNRQRSRVIEMIQRIHHVLSRGRNGANIFEASHYVTHAKVPICVGKHLPTGLKYQVQSTSSAQTSLAYARSYQDEFPTLRALFWLLKHLLHVRGLDEGRTHGLGGYPTLIMLVAALKMGAGSYNGNDVGGQLLYLLDFYTKHDFSKYCIFVQPLELVLKRPATKTLSSSEKTLMQSEDDEVAREAAWRNDFMRKTFASDNQKGRGYLMCLQDPADPFNNLGANAWKIKHIQATLVHLKRMLDQNLEIFAGLIGAKGRDARTIRNFSLLRPLIGANYTEFLKARTKLRIGGERVP